MREGRISYGFSRVALSKYPGSLFGRYPMMPEKPADTETAGGRELACLLCALTAQGKSRMIGNRNTVEKCRSPWGPHGLGLLTQPVHTFHAKRRPVQKPHPLSSFCPVHAAGREAGAGCVLCRFSRLSMLTREFCLCRRTTWNIPNRTTNWFPPTA